MNIVKLVRLLSSQKQKLFFSTQASSAIIENFNRKTNNIKSITSFRNILILQKNTDQKLKYPLVWLRDNCTCNECFHESSRSRVIDWEKFQVNPKLQNIVHDRDDQKIIITWEDGHISTFHEQWLVDRNFTLENRERYLDEVYRPTKRYWTKMEFNNILQYFDYNEVLESDKALHDWLDCLSKYGIAILKNTPLEKDQNRKLASRVAFIKNTHYGEEYEVKAAENVSNVAYLSAHLQMHTDLPYYEYKPGVNMLHCLVQSKSKGGENLISDGFHVAKIMQREFPEYYKVLSQTLVNWNDLGKEHNSPFHSIYRAPVICEDREGTLVRINHSIPQRDSFFSIPFELVQYWYEAMAKFVEILHEESVTFKTKEGDILTFDNLRLVHGRTKYEDNNDNRRHLIGAYLDWDEIYSRLRVLKFNLAEK